MAPLFSKCESCKKRRLIVKRRTYVHPIAGKIKSQSELCGKCYKDIKKMLLI